MQLFKFKEIHDIAAAEYLATAEPANAHAIGFIPVNLFITGDKLEVLKSTIGDLKPDHCIHFKTDGAWSNIHLVEYILLQTGPASVHFTTWSISADAIARFTGWQNQGIVTSIHAVLDAGIRNRKPELYQQSTAAFTNLAISHVHAKIIVIQNATHSITVMGSANFTRNPRIETGCITWHKELADSHIKWILEEFKNG